MSPKLPISSKNALKSKSNAKTVVKRGNRTATKTVQKTRSAATKALAQRMNVALAAPTLFDQAQESDQFTGTLFMANGQASLNGTLLLLDGLSDFSSAVAAAFGALQNKGFQSGQTITVTGRSAVVHLDEHPISVIIMTNAQAG